MIERPSQKIMQMLTGVLKYKEALLKQKDRETDPATIKELDSALRKIDTSFAENMMINLEKLDSMTDTRIYISTIKKLSEQYNSKTQDEVNKLLQPTVEFIKKEELRLTTANQKTAENNKDAHSIIKVTNEEGKAELFDVTLDNHKTATKDYNINDLLESKGKEREKIISNCSSFAFNNLHSEINEDTEKKKLGSEIAGEKKQEYDDFLSSRRKEATVFSFQSAMKNDKLLAKQEKAIEKINDLLDDTHPEYMTLAQLKELKDEIAKIKRTEFIDSFRRNLTSTIQGYKDNIHVKEGKVSALCKATEIDLDAQARKDNRLRKKDAKNEEISLQQHLADKMKHAENQSRGLDLSKLDEFCIDFDDDRKK